jgi:four helix bundle protein
MTPADLKERTTEFAVSVGRFCRLLALRDGSFEVPRQLSDSSSSVASNYRCACRARSRGEFVAKIGVAVEEAEETVGWLEYIRKADLARRSEMIALEREAAELLAILAKSYATAKRNLEVARRRAQAEKARNRKSIANRKSKNPKS